MAQLGQGGARLLVSMHITLFTIFLLFL